MDALALCAEERLMGRLTFAQDGVSVEVEWPYGALEVRDFLRLTEHVTGIHKALVGPVGSGGRKPVALAANLVYEPEAKT